MALLARSSQALFEELEGELALRRSHEPGLSVFCVNRQTAEVGELWLRADGRPRAGVVGRHTFSDLSLGDDESLSLRHVLFVVERHGAGVEFAAIDLRSSMQLRLDGGPPVTLVQSEGLTFLEAAQFLLICVPTGQPLPWTTGAGRGQAWASRQLARASRVETGLERGGDAVGVLRVSGPEGERAMAITSGAAARGVVLGRSERCDLVIAEGSVSRVHCVVLGWREELLLIDAGSTNGVSLDEESVGIVRLVPGLRLELSDTVLVAWHAAH